MKRRLMAIPIVALTWVGFAPAVQATGFTTSGQQSGSEHCSGGDAALDTGAAVGVVEAGQSDWYSVTSDEPVTIRWRPASTQFVTGISDIRVYRWNPDPEAGQLECSPLEYDTNSPFAFEPPYLRAHIELGPFPPGQYQVQVRAWNSQVPAQAYVLTSTPA